MAIHIGFYFYPMRLLRWLILLLPFSVSAQTDLITVTTKMIVAKHFDTANRYLDSLLQINPQNVDALMMKGNVILNRDLENEAPLQVITPEDENIYTQNIGYLDNPVKVVTDSTLAQVESYWLQCLKIDSARTDIIKGLCTLYGMALKEDKLKNEILKLKKSEPDSSGRQAYLMAEYARKMKERHQFAMAMEVYRFIAQQYPGLAGIRCDMASEYFYHGDLKLALQWLDSAFVQKNIDETTYLNGAFIYSELGFFDNAQQQLDAYSKKYDRKMNQFYNGLRQFADSTKGWVDVLRYFAETVDSNAYSNEISLAKTLLQYRDSFTLDDYNRLIQSNTPDYYKVLIYQRAVRQFKSSCKPFLDYGIYENNLKNFSASTQFFEAGEQCNLDSSLLVYWQLNYGYALFMSGNYPKALLMFQPLLQSNILFFRHASAYFIAKIMLAQNEPVKAETYLNTIKESKIRTKYVSLAQMLSRQMKN